MEAAKNAYRIRIGDYRVGFYLIKDEIIFSRVLNRKEMYRYFPRK
jgi:mRNA-degrading endonuclease RelE of RelBE toxin-antitoxin system